MKDKKHLNDPFSSTDAGGCLSLRAWVPVGISSWLGYPRGLLCPADGGARGKGGRSRCSGGCPTTCASALTAFQEHLALDVSRMRGADEKSVARAMSGFEANASASTSSWMHLLQEVPARQRGPSGMPIEHDGAGSFFILFNW